MNGSSWWKKCDHAFFPLRPLRHQLRQPASPSVCSSNQGRFDQCISVNPIPGCKTGNRAHSSCQSSRLQSHKSCILSDMEGQALLSETYYSQSLYWFPVPGPTSGTALLPCLVRGLENTPVSASPMVPVTVFPGNAACTSATCSDGTRKR